ncbi:MAG: photosynthetic protein synthase I [Betaproteobacteria bacterium SG8_41]|nr:MAG: photosynthetic protein synthase I [Betaproteobacteria bacterium SG8_41]
MLAALLAGCERAPQPPAFQLTDVTGAEFGRGFSLTDHNGRARTLADFRGKVVTVFFGFTHCPDVCPTALAEMAEVMRELGPDAQKVQVLLITVDPERDTAEVLRQYVPSFHASFLGLHGDADAIARTAKEFKVFYQKQALPGGGYSVDHSAGTYMYDREGRLRLYASHGRGAAALVHDIRILLQNS